MRRGQAFAGLKRSTPPNETAIGAHKARQELLARRRDAEGSYSESSGGEPSAKHRRPAAMPCTCGQCIGGLLSPRTARRIRACAAESAELLMDTLPDFPGGLMRDAGGRCGLALPLAI